MAVDFEFVSQLDELSNVQSEQSSDEGDGRNIAL